MDLALHTVLATATPFDIGGGRVAYLKPLTPHQVLTRLGRIPAAFANTVESAMDPVAKKKSEVFARENPEFAARWLACILCESVVALAVPDPEGAPARSTWLERLLRRQPRPPVVTQLAKVVEKPQAECAANELALETIQDDVEFVNGVVNGAITLNGWSREAAESAKPFLRGPGAAWLAGAFVQSLRAESGRRDEVTAH